MVNWNHLGGGWIWEMVLCDETRTLIEIDYLFLFTIFYILSFRFNEVFFHNLFDNFIFWYFDFEEYYIIHLLRIYYYFFFWNFLLFAHFIGKTRGKKTLRIFLCKFFYYQIKKKIIPKEIYDCSYICYLNKLSFYWTRCRNKCMNVWLACAYQRIRKGSKSNEVKLLLIDVSKNFDLICSQSEILFKA